MTAPPHRAGTQVIDAATGGAVERAAACLQAGGLVAFPTETVYGLGGDACDGRAVAAIFAAKGRPAFNPLISHLAAAEDADAFAVLNADARRLAEAFWPGALTLVLPARRGCAISDLARAGLDTVALRVPRHPVAQRLLRRAGRPIAAPSANRSGRLSPTAAADVVEELAGAVDLVLDGGRCTVGLESTVIACSGDAPALLRPGGLALEDIEAVVGPVRLPAATPGAPASPGQLESHYAPETPLRMNAQSAGEGELFLAFGPHETAAENLSAAADLGEAAATLFAKLRALDRRGARRIAVGPVPDTGLGRAINDRLRRAAAARRTCRPAAERLHPPHERSC